MILQRSRLGVLLEPMQWWLGRNCVECAICPNPNLISTPLKGRDKMLILVILWPNKPKPKRVLYSYLKKCKKSLNEAKGRVFNATPKIFPRSTERLFMMSKTQISKINCKIKSILSGLVTRTLYFLKKYDTKQPFSPSCRNWPICG